MLLFLVVGIFLSRLAVSAFTACSPSNLALISAISKIASSSSFVFEFVIERVLRLSSVVFVDFFLFHDALQLLIFVSSRFSPYKTHQFPSAAVLTARLFCRTTPPLWQLFHSFIFGLL